MTEDEHMDAFVYIRGTLPRGLDEIEDAIGEALGDAGEVTGSGTGTKGSNFDIEVVDEGLDAAAIVALLRTALTKFQLPPSVIVVNDVEYTLIP
jgi:hypothetical protein